MNKEILEMAMHEAGRFLATANDVIQRMEHDKYVAQGSGGSKETGACRRASMDLTRALAKLRRIS